MLKKIGMEILKVLLGLFLMTLAIIVFTSWKPVVVIIFVIWALCISWVIGDHLVDKVKGWMHGS